MHTSKQPHLTVLTFKKKKKKEQKNKKKMWKNHFDLWNQSEIETAECSVINSLQMWLIILTTPIAANGTDSFSGVG